MGLTLLAVAKGRFPLSSKESRSNDSGTGSDTFSGESSPDRPAGGVVGGAAGYWAMIKAICDDEPPKAGPFFSKEFNEFIAACLKKDPSARSSAKQLLTTPFIEQNASSLKMSFSDLQMRRKTSNPNNQHNQNHNEQAPAPAVLSAQDKSPPQTSADHSFEGEAKDTPPRKLSVETSQPYDGPFEPPAPSPLTTRLTNAAIVRRTSKEFPAFDSPTNLMHKALTEADRDSKAAQEASSLAAAAASGGLAISAKITIREDVEEEDVQFIDGAKKAHDVIISIRLEHLDRVLDRIAHKLGSYRRLGSASFDYNGEEAGVSPVGEEEYDDTQDHDLADIHHYTDEFNAVRNDPMLEGHDSVDSMDKLLQYKHGEPSPPVMQLPTSKFPAHGKHDAVPEMAADAKHVAPHRDEAAAHGHKGDDVDVKAAAAEDKKGLDEKHSAHHSILKVRL